MAQPWPRELLAHDACKVVHVALAKKLCKWQVRRGCTYCIAVQQYSLHPYGCTGGGGTV